MQSVPAKAQAPARKTWRLVIVALVTALNLALNVPDLILPWHPWSSFGFNAPFGHAIASVAPGSAAADAGIVAGDALDAATTDPDARRYLANAYGAAPAGMRARFGVIDRQGAHRAVTLVARVHERSLLDNLADIAQNLTYAVFLIVAAILVMLRPSALTWAFFAYAQCVPSGSLLLEADAPLPVAQMSWTVGDLGSVGWIPLCIFALHLLNDDIRGWRLWMQRALLVSAVIFV